MPEEKRGLKGRDLNMLKLETSWEVFLLDVFESRLQCLYWEKNPVALVWCICGSKLSNLYKAGHQESKKNISLQFEEDTLCGAG